LNFLLYRLQHYLTATDSSSIGWYWQKGCWPALFFDKNYSPLLVKSWFTATL